MELTDERRLEVDRLERSIRSWAEARPDIRAVLVVGSWARGAATMASDLDVVVLTDEKSPYTERDDWIEAAVGEAAAICRRAEWGPLLTERRIRLRSGFEVEFGFAPTNWAATDPLDPGTVGVVRDGCWPLHDPQGLVAALLDASRSVGGGEP